VARVGELVELVVFIALSGAAFTVTGVDEAAVEAIESAFDPPPG
jgi:hypothetical protein